MIVAVGWLCLILRKESSEAVAFKYGLEVITEMKIVCKYLFVYARRKHNEFAIEAIIARKWGVHAKR